MRNYLKYILIGFLTAVVLTACGLVEKTVKTSGTKTADRSATDSTRANNGEGNSALAPRVSETDTAPTPNGRTDQNVCGINPLGSVKCSIALQEALRSWQFTIVYTGANGKRTTYTGERAQTGGKTIIHATISGAGRGNDGEWWFRLGASPLDNGQRVYFKQNGAWQRVESPPDNFGEVLPNSNPVGVIDGGSATVADGTETIEGEVCSRFRNSSGNATTTIWISRTNGYALRKIFAESGNTIQTDAARHNAIASIETPAGAE